MNAKVESRLSRIEVEVHAIRDLLAQSDAPPEPRFVPAPNIPAIVQPLPPRRPALDFEQIFGGRFLLGAGGLAFFIGVAFFLKYAFDNGWVGPSGRVAMGLAGGVLLMLGSEPILRAGHRYYAHAIAGLGAAVLYLSLWAAGSYFHLLPLYVTFGAMAVVTAAVMAIAIRRNSELFAFAALAGGFLTPALSQPEHMGLTVIFSYLAVLGSAMVWLGRSRWRRLEIAAFAATQIYFFAYAPLSASGAWSGARTTALIFATIYLLQYSLLPFIRTRRLGSLETYECAMVGIAATLYYFTLHMQLFEMHRHVLTALTVTLAAGYLALAQAGNAQTRATFASISLALITVGVGITFDAHNMAMVWAAEAAALLVLGFRRDSNVAKVFGLIAYACAAVSFPEAMLSGTPFFNHRFTTLVTFGAGLAALAIATDRFTKGSQQKDISYISQTLAHGFFLTAFAFELHKIFHGSPLALSLLMLAYAAMLVAGGFSLKREFLRWEGLALFAALVVKVFVVDLSSVDTIVRIVSFLAVGAVLLVVALAYQRRRNHSVQPS